MNRAQKFLAAMAVVQSVALSIVILVPPPIHGYPQEQGLLLVLALAALLTSRINPTGAVFLYCTFALFPVGAMLEYYKSIGGGWSALEAAPLLGILFVAVLLRNERATLLYGGIAVFASGVFSGQICNDWGQAGAMAFLSGGLSGALYAWLGCNLQKIQNELDEQRGALGELKQIEAKRQEFLHDRRPPPQRARP